MLTHRSEQLRKILESARAHIPENEFCGIGVVLYLIYDGLPVLPLCSYQEFQKGSSLAEQLAQASLFSNPCHDGFHLISDEFQLTHTNQYLAPPLPSNTSVYSRSKETCGARYMSAQIGSLLPMVSYTGILSDKEGVVIFEDGIEIK
ncbi:hypothetical protein [Nitrosococcus wardiae]|uniref:DAC domain-containing protein n=1 Tax=Nitrosococcus wardiae TaxID=1814290 RepID=A0A4P7C2T9_9GAMM|nr:hypothetical protein [Nitrosococcus wardiae]QBQ56007.1 hypothetical protein E3U44_16935 [Nitrosococcus wardiae]